MNKNCILFVVDALAESVTRESISKGQLPTLAKLLDHGGKLSPCNSIFPSITPAATCSIASGAYPREHGIQGACWFDPERNDAAYYGDDVQLALQEGFTNYLVDFADRLNFERLQRPLIFEHLSNAGIDSVCVNYMWFRGTHIHSRSTPLGLRILSGKLDPEIHGPRYLKLGDFVHDLPEGTGDVSGMTSGLTGRYGFHDKTTAACMMAMAKAGTLPPFSLAYFPLNDDLGHEVGLHEAASKCLVEFDEFLDNFVEALGGWDRVNQEYALLVVGDHAQQEWVDQEKDNPRLDLLLEDYKIADTGAGFSEDDELLICPNMRAAAIYPRQRSREYCDRIIEQLLESDGVDQVIDVHREDSGSDASPSYVVRTRDRGQLRFARAEVDFPDREQVIRDGYGNQWGLTGSLKTLDCELDDDGKLREGIYPNPLERIEGAFTDGPSPIWVTAGSNTEFAIAETATHAGGSHGSLHVDDTRAGLITNAEVDLSSLPNPESPRIVDVMSLCLKALGVETSDPHEQVSGR